MDSDFIKWRNKLSQYFENNKVRFEKIINRYYYSGHLLKRKRIEKVHKITKKMLGNEIYKHLLDYSGEAKFINYYQTVLMELTKTYNQEGDVFLLKHDRNSLVLKYRKLIDEVKMNLLVKGILTNTQLDDLLNHVNLALLEKDFNKNYNEKKLFSNYLWTIVHNECISYLKSKQSKVCLENEKFYKNYFKSTIKYPDAEISLMLEEEFVRFDRILSTFDKKRPKIELCLKVQYLIDVCANDILQLNHKVSITETNKLVEKINNSYNKNKSKKPKNAIKRFEIILPALNNKPDKNHVKVSNVIRWTNSKINELINILNNGYARSCFDNMTFSIFIEKYFYNN